MPTIGVVQTRCQSTHRYINPSIICFVRVKTLNLPQNAWRLKKWPRSGGPWLPCPSHNALLLQTLAHLKPLRRSAGDQQLGTGPRKQSLGDPQVDLAGRAEVGAASQWVWYANRNHFGNFRDPIKTHGEVAEQVRQRRNSFALQKRRQKKLKSQRDAEVTYYIDR
jgi:hypothetical protein